MTTDKYRNISLDSADGQSMMALINGDRGWLMYLIPTPLNQNSFAHALDPIDVIVHGRSISLFQASQQSATMSS